MNNSNQRSIRPSDLEALESRFAFRVAARLNEQSEGVGDDISERLRVAREQALARARVARSSQALVQTAAVTMPGALGAGATLGGGNPGWWVKLGSVLPLLVLAAGLLLIDQWNTRSQISAAAEIDAALLADDLPPDAYSDAGFAEFLKAPRD